MQCILNFNVLYAYLSVLYNILHRCISKKSQMQQSQNNLNTYKMTKIQEEHTKGGVFN